MGSDSSAEVDDRRRGSADFTGCYRLTKTNHLDAYLRAQGWPWVVRKTCSKFGQHATDIVQQQGQTLTIATLNAKGVWLRRYTEGKEVSQPNAAGVVCKTTACWEGKVHKSRMQAKNGDTWETWRYLEAGVMVVKSIFTDSRGSQGHMYWYFEAIRAPAAHTAADLRRVVRIAGADTARLQRLAAPRSKWETPADHIIERAGSANDSPRKDVVSGTTSPLSQISPMGSGILNPNGGGSGGASVAATRAHSGVAPGPPPPSEASQRDPQSEAAERAESVPERGILKSPSSESFNALASADNARSDSASLGGAKGGASSAEALLSFLVAEFGDGRSIAAVVPLRARLAALEPELLGLSPEQAEDTQLKLAELEDQVSKASAGRARHAAGTNCGCCTLLLHRYTIPEYLRSWDL